jgi:hypothetical protein
MTRVALNAPTDPYMVGVHVRARLLGMPILSLEARVVAGRASTRSAERQSEAQAVVTSSQGDLDQAVVLWNDSAELLNELRTTSVPSLTS